MESAKAGEESKVWKGKRLEGESGRGSLCRVRALETSKIGKVLTEWMKKEQGGGLKGRAYMTPQTLGGKYQVKKAYRKTRELESGDEQLILWAHQRPLNNGR